MTKTWAAAMLALSLACATALPPPQWNAISEASEAEYNPYLQAGSCTIAGEASLAQPNGSIVKPGGETVTLDPATTVGKEWWNKIGNSWQERFLTPSSPGFQKARRTTTTDAEGRFEFTDVPAGSYYVRTQIPFQVGAGYYPTRYGLVGTRVTVKEGQAVEVKLNTPPK